MKKKTKTMILLFCIGLIASFTSCKKERTCHCTLTWTNPNMTVYAPRERDVTVDRDETCTNAAMYISDYGVCEYTCSEK